MRVASAGLAYWVARFFLLGTKARILGLTRHDRKIQRITKLNVGCGPSSSVKQVFLLSLASIVYTARY